MLLFKLKLAIRNLLKDKINSVLIIGGFSIGFAAFILIGLFYLSEHKVNSNFDNSENIYRIYDAKRNSVNLDYDLYPILWEEFPEIENACPMEYVGGFDITVKDSELDASARLNQVVTTTGNFFDIFSIEVVSSMSNKPFAIDQAVVLSETAAKRIYGSVNPLGRTLKSDWFEGEITAVIKDLPHSASFQAELILNTANEDFRWSQSCNDGKCWYTTPHFVELNKSTNIEQLALKINHSIKSLNSNTDSLSFQKVEDIYLSTLPIKDAHAKGNSKMLSIFLVIGVLIVLLSSINYLNFTVSTQYSKLKEIGINKTNGANVMDLFSKSLVEVSLGIILSVVIAMVLTVLFMPFAETMFGKSIYLSELNLAWAISLFLGIIFLVILINTVAPIYVLTRFKIADFLAGSIKRSGKQFGKQAMLTFQLVASIALITIVLFIFRQLDHVKHHHLGFNEKHLVRFDLPFFYEAPSTLKEEIGKLPFVEGSTLSDGYPGHIKLRMGAGTKDKRFSVQCIHISDDYLKTMGMTMLEGRKFHLGDENKVCLMNEEAIKKFEWNNIDSKIYKQGSKDGYKVVGVVKNFNIKSLHSGIEPVALLYNPDQQFGTLSVRLYPGNLNDQLKGIEKVWKQILPNEPMFFNFYDQQFQALYEKEERMAKSISFFSIIAIVLTCMGILGQILLISLTRTKEIGVRKVNGAKVSEILTMLNSDFIKWVGIAFIIACPIAYYAMNKWLENFAYKTTLSWWIFALAGLLALGIALLTVSFQSFKAATRNPIESLRYE